MNTGSGSTSPVPSVATDADDARDAHLRTDHLLGDLRGRSIRGGAVTLTAQGVKFALQMGSTMLLARLLTPADFGLVAMVTTVTGFAAMFKDAGLSMATVQREEVTHAQISVLFWINVSLSMTVMCVVAALAPLIARFYEEPRLVAITLALSTTLLFSGLTVQHQALLRRQMKFKELAIIEILSTTAGFATAIVMAFAGFGYWSLVGAIAGSTLANCTLVWGISRWRPGQPRRKSGVSDLLKFGGSLTGFNFINYFNRNLDNVLIGYYLGAGALGIYSKAYSLLLLPLRELNGPASAVLLPALSRLQSDPPRFRRAYLRAAGMLAYAGLAIVGFAFVAAPELILIVLGDGWEGATLVFRCLFLAAVAGALNVLPGWLFLALGRADRQLKWVVPGSIPILAGIVLGIPWGVVGVGLGCSGGYFLSWIAGTWYASRGSPVKMKDILVSLALPVCSMAAGMAIALISRHTFLTDTTPMLMRLLVISCSFAGGWIGLILLVRPKDVFIGLQILSSTARSSIRRGKP
jgi:O-antigen/teichoic acid export membrane protein